MSSRFRTQRVSQTLQEGAYGAHSTGHGPTEPFEVLSQEKIKVTSYFGKWKGRASAERFVIDGVL